MDTELYCDLPSSPKPSDLIVSIISFSAKPNWAKVYTLWANDRAKLSFTCQAGSLADRLFYGTYDRVRPTNCLNSDEEVDLFHITKSMTTSLPKNTGIL